MLEQDPLEDGLLRFKLLLPLLWIAPQVASVSHDTDDIGVPGVHEVQPLEALERLGEVAVWTVDSRVPRIDHDKD